MASEDILSMILQSLGSESPKDFGGLGAYPSSGGVGYGAPAYAPQAISPTISALFGGQENVPPGIASAFASSPSEGGDQADLQRAVTALREPDPAYQVPQPAKFTGKDWVAAMLGNVSDALNAGLRARGLPMESNAVNTMLALRQRRAELAGQGAYEQSRQAVEQRRAKAAGDIAAITARIEGRQRAATLAERQSEKAAEETLRAQQLAQEKSIAEAKIKQDQFETNMRKTIADSENAMRLRVAQIEKSTASTEDKVAARQMAKEERTALVEAKKGALQYRDQVVAGTMPLQQARQQFKDRVEAELSDEGVNAAMAWFDLKVAEASKAATQTATPEKPVDYSTANPAGWMHFLTALRGLGASPQSPQQ